MNVALLNSELGAYTAQAPFHPAESYPELAQLGVETSDMPNPVYGAVRDLFTLLGLDACHHGTPEWNPFSEFIQPGQNVVIKPNLVLHEFGALLGSHCLTTQGAVLRAVADYAALAAGPEGRVTIADAPLQGADFEQIMAQSGIHDIAEYHHTKLRRELRVLDLRQVRAIIDESSSLIMQVDPLPGDPAGYTAVNLGRESRLATLDRPETRYVVGDYDSAQTNTRHNCSRHEYVIANTLLQADTIISVPKLKTHSKVGLTVCLKNLIGIIGSKDSLPHHRHGRVGDGGDEFPENYPLSWYLSNRANHWLQARVPRVVWRALRLAARVFLGAGTTPTGDHANGFFPSGGWCGNDTIWRTVDDLNRILYFYDTRKHRLSSRPQRRFFALVDGIIAMEGNGPLRGSPRPCGVLLAGIDPVAIDVVAATLMGFDWKKIPMLAGASQSGDLPAYSQFCSDIGAIKVSSNAKQWSTMEQIAKHSLRLRPPAGWVGNIESPAHVG